MDPTYSVSISAATHGDDGLNAPLVTGESSPAERRRRVTADG